ncbi:MAG: NUDIX hydrolase [Bacteroidia bacterium]|nr:NUDIX hydrolase [Bacteroidia bacterium]
MYTYEYPRPALTVDCIIFGVENNQLKVLLIQRGEEPFKGAWALPGGFVLMGEDLEEAARRELEEETSVRDVYLEQLYTFGQPGRDPRGRVVTVAYFALVNLADHQIKASTDASAAAWFAVSNLPSLAFDHQNILEVALERLRGKIKYRPIGFELLPEKFLFSQLEKLYEAILLEPIDRRNFRKKIMKTGLLKAHEIQKGVPHKRGRFFSFDKEKYLSLEKEGFEFTL